jgi:indolepyruvate ferredoxin oxidoreductase
MVRGALPVIGGETAVATLRTRTDPTHTIFVDANRLAEGLFGSHLAANILLLGAAYQAGLIPVSAQAIEEAIRLNRVEEKTNLRAFQVGRLYVHDPRRVKQILEEPEPRASADVVARRVTELTRYQNASYAAEYASFVQSVVDQAPELREMVARGLFKLMAYKDEYEVARLLTRPDFQRNMDRMWEAMESVSFNLHPPFLRALGWKRKIQAGGWARLPLTLLSRLRFLRGTWLDPFGYQRCRKEERELIAWYRGLVEQTMEILTPENLSVALEIVAIPEMIRGYEDVKRRSIARAKAAAAEKLGTMERQPALK